MSNKLSGKPLNWINDYYGGQDPDFPPMDSETREKISRMIQAARPKDLPSVGRVQVYGTTGDMDGNENLKELFYKPDNYKFKDDA
jgi:hypothetical protein